MRSCRMREKIVRKQSELIEYVHIEIFDFNYVWRKKEFKRSLDVLWRKNENNA